MRLARKSALFTLTYSSSLLVNNSQASSDFPGYKRTKTLQAFTATYPANNPTEDRAIKLEVVNDWQCSAIFDGHGGWQVSEFASKLMFDVIKSNFHGKKLDPSNKSQFRGTLDDILIQSYENIENKYLDSIRNAYKMGYGEVAKVGCCALVVMKKDNHLVTANCGDCRAILGTQLNTPTIPSTTTPNLLTSPSYLATRLTNDHNAREPFEKQKLYQEHPGEADVVICKNEHACYVKGRLQLTRALGDAYLKYNEFNAPPNMHRSGGRHIPDPYTPPYVSYTPEINHIELTRQDKFLILATDGIWDFLSDQDAVNIVANTKNKNTVALELVEKALEVASKEANISLKSLKSLPQGRDRRSIHDDTTVVVVYLNED